MAGRCDGAPWDEGAPWREGDGRQKRINVSGRHRRIAVFIWCDFRRSRLAADDSHFLVPANLSFIRFNSKDHLLDNS